MSGLPLPRISRLDSIRDWQAEVECDEHGEHVVVMTDQEALEMADRWRFIAEQIRMTTRMRVKAGLR